MIIQNVVQRLYHKRTQVNFSHILSLLSWLLQCLSWQPYPLYYFIPICFADDNKCTLPPCRETTSRDGSGWLAFLTFSWNSLSCRSSSSSSTWIQLLHIHHCIFDNFERGMIRKSSGTLPNSPIYLNFQIILCGGRDLTWDSTIELKQVSRIS